MRRHCGWAGDWSCGWIYCWICGILFAVAAGRAAAQQSNSTLQTGMADPPASIAEVLRSMASRAGVVFVGRVQRIVPDGSVVEVDFQVEQPVLGVAAGRYVAREWAGRWSGGQQRYRVGQRAMYFLHAPGASGLSSAVDGMMGIVPVIPMGANAGALVDVRWLATRVKRSVGSPLAGGNASAITLADATAVVSQWQMRLPEPVLYPMPGGTLPRPVRVVANQGSGASGGGAPAGPPSHGLLQRQMLPQENNNAQR